MSLGSRQKASLQTGYRVRLGDVWGSDEVERLSAQQLQFTVPADVPSGQYDLELTPPSGEVLRLPAALTVRAASQITATLSLETSGDGQGERISERSLSVGDTLELFAVWRAADGSFVGADRDVTFTQEPVLGELSSVYAAASVWSALIPGDVTVRAESDTGEQAEVSLHVAQDAQHQLTDYRLSLEDAPGGAGAPLGPERSLVAGERLECYTVVRRSGGDFVLDVPASWGVSGAQGVPLTIGASLSLTLQNAGDTVIEASFGALAASSLVVHVAPGRAAALQLQPQSAVLQAGGSALSFTVSGQDAFGNDTADLGVLRYSVADGSFGDLDSSSATLTPRRVGSGHVSVVSAYGPEAQSALIEVTPGPLARLSVVPYTLQLSADAAPVQFQALGLDAFDNPTDALGALTWSIDSGSIGSLSELGLFDATTVGKGTIGVTSSLGAAAQSGEIEVTVGSVYTLNLTPQTWSGQVGDPSQQFVVTGKDADGNLTSDVGSIEFRVASGTIAEIDAQSGVFTPLAAGVGTIEASSSYGLSVTSQPLVVSPQGASLRVSAIRAPSSVWAGEAAARIEVDVTSSDVAEAVITGVALSFVDSSWGADISDQFTVVAHRDNTDHIAPGATQTLVFYVDVASLSSSLGTMTITATSEAFFAGRAPFVFAGSTTSSNRFALFPPSVSVVAPTPPQDRVCSGGGVAFQASTSSFFSSATYAWRFEGGSLAPGSSLTDQGPSVDYAAVGNYLSSVTATYFGYPTTALAAPVYVGSVAPAAVDSYPTGHIVFSAPASGQSVALSGLPRSDLIALSAAAPVGQCDGSAVAASGHRELTLFSDRRLIDPAADIDALAPGIQVALTDAGGLGAVPLRAATSQLEGSSTLYAEYFEPSSGSVTAAGDITFGLSGDTLAPSVSWSAPASDCAATCLRPGEPLIVQFSEPVLASSLNGARVELFSGSTCSGTPSADLTSSSELVYEPEANAYYITPAPRSGTYAVRVRLPSSITDTAAARNPLATFSRCLVFGSAASPVLPAPPQLLAAAAATFSPDGDQDADSVSFQVSVDAATTVVRLRIGRAGKVLWSRLLPVAQAGSYTFVWDGTDQSGRVVNNGAYSYTLQALNRAGAESAAVRGYVEVASAAHLVSVRRRQ